MSLRIENLVQNKRRRINVNDLPKREVLPLKKVKTFTAYLTKDIKIPAEMQHTMVGAKTIYAVDLEKGDKVSVTEFFDGETFYVIDGESWYFNELKKKRELKEVQEGKKDPSKNALRSSLFFFSKYGLGKNPSKEEIQKKIDEPIKRPFGMFGFRFGGNTGAVLINKNDFALNRETSMSTTTKKTNISSKSNRNLLMYGLIAVAGYFAYKNLK